MQKSSCTLLWCYGVAILMFGTNNLEHSRRHIDSLLSNIGVFYWSLSCSRWWATWSDIRVRKSCQVLFLCDFSNVLDLLEISWRNLEGERQCICCSICGHLWLFCKKICRLTNYWTDIKYAWATNLYHLTNREKLTFI
jgi:hypothetical protein